MAGGEADKLSQYNDTKNVTALILEHLTRKKITFKDYSQAKKSDQEIYKELNDLSRAEVCDSYIIFAGWEAYERSDTREQQRSCYSSFGNNNISRRSCLSNLAKINPNDAELYYYDCVKEIDSVSGSRVKHTEDAKLLNCKRYFTSLQNINILVNNDQRNLIDSVLKLPNGIRDYVLSGQAPANLEDFTDCISLKKNNGNLDPSKIPLANLMNCENLLRFKLYSKKFPIEEFCTAYGELSREALLENNFSQAKLSKAFFVETFKKLEHLPKCDLRFTTSFLSKNIYENFNTFNNFLDATLESVHTEQFYQDLFLGLNNNSKKFGFIQKLTLYNYQMKIAKKFSTIDLVYDRCKSIRLIKSTIEKYEKKSLLVLRPLLDSDIPKLCIDKSQVNTYTKLLSVDHQIYDFMKSNKLSLNEIYPDRNHTILEVHSILSAEIINSLGFLANEYKK
jgi:hypothetical protein